MLLYELHEPTHSPGRTKICEPTLVCAITLVCSESYKFIRVRNVVSPFVSFVNCNVRCGFQQYLHIFLHNFSFTHDTLNRCPAESPCSSVHFTPLPVSLISVFSSLNLVIASSHAWGPAALRLSRTSEASLKYFIEVFAVWTLSFVPCWKRQLKCHVLFLFSTKHD